MRRRSCTDPSLALGQPESHSLQGVAFCWLDLLHGTGNLSPILSRTEVEELLEHGSIHTSPGGQYSFRVLGPCCRLFDREELPWPCCRLAWRSKEPSWRRVGRRFVPDLAAQRCPSYAVELLQPGSRPSVTVLTLFPLRFSKDLQEWWYSRHPRSMDLANLHPAA